MTAVSAGFPDARKNRTMQKKALRRIVVLLLLGAALGVGYGLGLFSSSTGKHGRLECLGEDPLSAPVFRLRDLQGKTVDLASFKGNVILLEFWATWCGPCKEEIRVLNELHQAYRPKGLVIVGISLDRKDPREVQDFVRNMGLEYINLMGDDEVFENYSRVTGQGSMRAIPASFLIDRQGRICKSFIGLTAKPVLEEAIRSIL